MMSSGALVRILQARTFQEGLEKVPSRDHPEGSAGRLATDAIQPSVGSRPRTNPIDGDLVPVDHVEHPVVILQKCAVQAPR